MKPSTSSSTMPGTRGAVDPRRREQYVGLGCALENLVFGCHARGLQTAVRVLPDGPLRLA
jgi:hypothetical protein